MEPEVLVAGIGNIFLGDDAFGVEVVRRLAQRALPRNVRVVDFGIRSYDLAYALMEDWGLVILVDAAPQGRQPGTVYLIEPEMPAPGHDPETGFDAHTMNPVSVLRMVAALGGRVGRILVVGCEPASIEADEKGRIGLSPPVERAVEQAIRMIEGLIVGGSRASAA